MEITERIALTRLIQGIEICLSEFKDEFLDSIPMFSVNS